MSEEGFKILSDKAENGDIAAQLSLGRIFEYGEMNQELDMEKAFSWYRKAAEKGDDLAAECLLRISGSVYESSYSNFGYHRKPEDADEALLALGIKGFESYKKKGLEENDDEANYRVAVVLLEGIMGDEKYRDITQGGIMIEKLAAKGNPFALYELGCAYKHGSFHGTEFKKTKYSKNPSLSFENFQKAANKGIVSAKYNLYEFLKKGIGCRKDDKKSCLYLASAAEDGMAEAQMEMAFKLFGYAGDKADLVNGFYWLEKAAFQGFEQARIQLAYCYLKGNGCRVDVKMSEFWANKARARKHINFPPVIKIGSIPNFN